MGRWGYGILDGDGPLDGVGVVVHAIEADVARYARTRPGPRTPARLGAAVGLLLQLSSYSFEDEEIAATIGRALRKHEANFGLLLPPEAASLLRRVAAGEGRALAARRGGRRGELAQALGRYLDGVREPSLFEHPLARAYAQKIALRCARRLERALAGGGLDLIDDDRWMGALGALLLVEPWSLPASRVEGWRARYEAALDALRPGDDPEPDLVDFEAALGPNVRLAFDLLSRRARGAA
ncbi:MAG TPA: hypothetical protein VFS43_31610 [Polyangiaceae bacterium]|nr:hypothetical protein [Polyangiaceae bacterium]